LLKYSAVNFAQCCRNTSLQKHRVQRKIINVCNKFATLLHGGTLKETMQIRKPGDARQGHYRDIKGHYIETSWDITGHQGTLGDITGHEGTSRDIRGHQEISRI